MKLGRCRHRRRGRLRRTWLNAQWNVLSGREYNIKYVHNQLITLPQCENPAKTLAAMMTEYGCIHNKHTYITVLLYIINK